MRSSHGESRGCCGGAGWRYRRKRATRQTPGPMRRRCGPAWRRHRFEDALRSGHVPELASGATADRRRKLLRRRSVRVTPPWVASTCTQGSWCGRATGNGSSGCVATRCGPPGAGAAARRRGRAGLADAAASMGGRHHSSATRPGRLPGAPGGARPAAARQPGALLRSPSGRVRCGARPSSPPPDRNGPTPRVPSVGPSSTRSPTPVASQRSLVPAGISGPI